MKLHDIKKEKIQIHPMVTLMTLQTNLWRIIRIEWLYAVQRCFQRYFSYITAASAPNHAFFELFLPALRTIFFPSHWLLTHLTIVETTDSGERWINPATMTIINPRKEYWPSLGSSQRPPFLKSETLPTELWSSAGNLESFTSKPYCLKISLTYTLKICPK